jgi:hypothetical protein
LSKRGQVSRESVMPRDHGKARQPTFARFGLAD